MLQGYLWASLGWRSIPGLARGRRWRRRRRGEGESRRLDWTWGAGAVRSPSREVRAAVAPRGVGQSQFGRQNLLRVNMVRVDSSAEFHSFRVQHRIQVDPRLQGPHQAA